MHPRLVIATHWNNFFKPLSEHLRPSFKFVDDMPGGFDFLIRRLQADGIRFGLLQGCSSVNLFAPARR